MKKIIIAVMMIGALGYVGRNEVSKQVKIVSIKMELRALNETSKQLEMKNRSIGGVKEEQFQELRNDKKVLVKELRRLQAL